jgi:hypothetical protein
VETAILTAISAARIGWQSPLLIRGPFPMNTNSDAPNGTESVLADDLLRGVKPIAEFIGESERRTFYLCQRGYIPCGKLGATWVGSKRVLRAHYARITQGTA